MGLSEWKQARNILCIRLDSAGDVLIITPALRALKESTRGRRLTLLTSRMSAEVAHMIPVVDNVMIYDAPWVKNDRLVLDSSREYEMAETLRQHRFDGAVIFSDFSENPFPSAFLCRLADIPLRLAYCRENPCGILTDWVDETERSEFTVHEVERQLALVKSIDCDSRDDQFSFRIPAYARRSVRKLLEEISGSADRPSIIIHPGAITSSCRYPCEHFVVVADAIVKARGATVIFTGNESEVGLVASIRSQMRMPSHSVAGRLDIPKLCALISSVDLIITNNTGPAHIAAAVGTRLVNIIAQSDPRHTPWKVESRVLMHDVPCKNCHDSVCPEGHHDCLRLISPETVINAANELLYH